MQIEIQYFMTINIEESDLDHFVNLIQTHLVPALEVMSVNIKQIEINQVRILISINLVMPPPIT